MSGTRDADDTFETDEYRLTVDTDGFRFGFERQGRPDITAHGDYGLALDGEPVTDARLVSDPGEAEAHFSVRTAGGRSATVTLVLSETTVEVTVAPEEPSPVELQPGGMVPSFGLGDEAHDTGDANMAGEQGFSGALRSLVDWNGVLSRGTVEVIAAG